ncbi:MAG: hypothetical protein ACM3PD_12040, partial [Chloroflexota bacterium]
SATPRPGTVNMVMRYSIPVFFEQADGEPPKLSWSYKKSKGIDGLTYDYDAPAQKMNITLAPEAMA